MKNIEFIILLTLMAILSFTSCNKNDSDDIFMEPHHNPLKGTVWENSYYETPGGEFDSYTDRLLFTTETSGKIFSMVSTVYYYGENTGDLWDTTVNMTYWLDTISNNLYINSDYLDNPGLLKYNKEEETLTVASNGKVYIRVM